MIAIKDKKHPTVLSFQTMKLGLKNKSDIWTLPKTDLQQSSTLLFTLLKIKKLQLSLSVLRFWVTHIQARLSERKLSWYSSLGKYRRTHWKYDLPKTVSVFCSCVNHV